VENTNRLEIIANALEEINPKNNWVQIVAELDTAGFIIIPKPDPHLMEIAAKIVEDRERVRRMLDDV